MNDSGRSPDLSGSPTPVEVLGVARLFGAVRALAGIRLRLEPGQFVLLVGPNGAGKSTLLRILASLLRPTAGHVLYGGRTAIDAGCALRSRLAFLAHRTQLHADLTGREAIELAAALRGAPAEAVEGWAERLRVRSFQGRAVRTYSRGQTQRVALARTFVGDPALVLLDEPTTGLDPDAVAVLQDLLGEQKARGATLVVATHDPQLFVRLADRTVRIEAGRVVSDTGPEAGA
ncbi:MAG: ABC transporter ATP-binding protein [Deltaproteobacteria bacterium]|nr:ABC transporter ATP-binding protein [Deltaproteobacteria bacterium]